jgi:hypothetical protein
VTREVRTARPDLTDVSDKMTLRTSKTALLKICGIMPVVEIGKAHFEPSTLENGGFSKSVLDCICSRNRKNVLNILPDSRGTIR